MKKYINNLKFNILLILFSSSFMEGIAQSYLRIEYPYVDYSTVNGVCIKCVEFTEYQTRIDFIACYTGHYIYLENPTQKNAMYIKIGNNKYRLRSTNGIASKNGVTYCKPGNFLEFTAFFDPIPNEERDVFDLREGISGSWNFYKISISKSLSKLNVPDWVPIDKQKENKANFEKETIEFPYVEKQSHPYIIISKIEKLNDITILHFSYKKPYDSYGLINLSKKIYIRTSDGKKYDVLHILNIPITNEFRKKGEFVSFTMIFPKLPDYVKCFSIYDPELFYEGKELIFHNIMLRSDYKEYLKKWNNMENYFKEKASSNTKSTMRKKLKKDPNFKID